MSNTVRRVNLRAVAVLELQHEILSLHAFSYAQAEGKEPLFRKDQSFFL